jgi:hypothetical protein
MLVWEANFQIPRSGTQAKYVFLFAEIENTSATLKFYSEDNKTNLLWEETIDVPNSITDIYSYIKSLEKYNQYQ